MKGSNSCEKSKGENRRSEIQVSVRFTTVQGNQPLLNQQSDVTTGICRDPDWQSTRKLQITNDL